MEKNLVRKRKNITESGFRISQSFLLEILLFMRSMDLEFTVALRRLQ